ncbi:hypothetical protein D3C85_1283190 [compost metagenome]
MDAYGIEGETPVICEAIERTARIQTIKQGVCESRRRSLRHPRLQCMTIGGGQHVVHVLRQDFKAVTGQVDIVRLEQAGLPASSNVGVGAKAIGRQVASDLLAE